MQLYSPQNLKPKATSLGRAHIFNSTIGEHAKFTPSICQDAEAKMATQAKISCPLSEERVVGRVVTSKFRLGMSSSSESGSGEAWVQLIVWKDTGVWMGFVPCPSSALRSESQNECWVDRRRPHGSAEEMGQEGSCEQIQPWCAENDRLPPFGFEV